MKGPSDDARAAASDPRGSVGLREGPGERPSGIADGACPGGGAGADRAAKTRLWRPERNRAHQPTYGALDLGTNNCRLLVARPSRRGFRVIDAFSRIIRLGEGVTQSRRLSEAAIRRTIEALKICSDKMRRRGVRRSRIIATEACRIAENRDEFVERVYSETGLNLEIVSRETEARLAVSGCASLLDTSCSRALVFDIGGGSSELIWVDLSNRAPSWPRSLADRLNVQNCISAWTSLPMGVVTLSERYGGREVSAPAFEAMVADVMRLLSDFEARHLLRAQMANGGVHMLGTSGTVTTIAGIHLGLPMYDRNRVDGCWLTSDNVRAVSRSLIAMSYCERVAQPCIGPDRADLVLAGCAILEALLRMWPCERLRVADRGLREGILATLMAEDGYPQARRRHSGRRRAFRS